MSKAMGRVTSLRGRVQVMNGNRFQVAVEEY